MVEDSIGLLFFHGLLSSPTELSPVVRRLQRKGVRVEIPAIRGYSFSAQQETSYQWRGWLEGAVCSFDVMSERYRFVAVAGLCTGALLAGHVAARRKVAALALLSTPLYLDGWSFRWHDKLLMRVVKATPLTALFHYRESLPFGLKNERLREKVAQEAKNGGLLTVGAGKLPFSAMRQCELMKNDLKRRLADIAAPTLILHAVDDETCSPRSAKELQARIGSAQRHLVLLDNSYHMITLDHDRDRVADEILEMLGGLSGGSHKG